MKLTTNNFHIGYNQRFSVWLCSFQIEEHLVNDINKLIKKNTPKSVEIKLHKENRSLSANAYLWVLLSKLSSKLTIPKGDLYIKMIKRYGEFTQLILKSEAVSQLFKQWDAANTSVEHVESLCEINRGFTRNGQKWVEVICHYGTSGYDTKQFSKVLEGVISECEIVGINTMTPIEIARLMANYEGSNE